MRTVRRTLTTDAAKILVHAFITSRVDYCNNVFDNASAVLLYPLQSVLHAAARVITRKESMIIFLQQSVVSYTGCQLNNGLTTSCALLFTSAYLRDMYIPVSSISGRSSLRSAAHGDLWNQRTRTKTFCPRAFAVLGPSIWNTLPATVRDPLLGYGQFCSKLKSVMFNRAYMT